MLFVEEGEDATKGRLDVSASREVRGPVAESKEGPEARERPGNSTSGSVGSVAAGVEGAATGVEGAAAEERAKSRNARCCECRMSFPFRTT